MRSIPSDLEELILKRVLEGATYRRVVHEFGTCLATVNRVVENARKRMPDVDKLIDLSTSLRRNGLNVFDAARGCRLLEALNKCGIDLEESRDYIELTERLLSEKSLTDDFISDAIKFKRLEQECGQPYIAVVDDFERKIQENPKLESIKNELKKEIAGYETDAKRVKEDLEKAYLEIEKATAVRKGLAEIGVNNLASLVKFVRDFEALGFDAHEVRKLTVWRRRLEKAGIDADQLDKFIAERGPLLTQNNILKLANDRLASENRALMSAHEKLLQENSSLHVVDRALKTRTVATFCKSCGARVRLRLETRERYKELVSNRMSLAIWCSSCRQWQSYDPREIATQIGWNLLPTDTLTG